MTAMENLLERILPPSMTYEWTELSLLEKRTGNTSTYVFILATTLVFLLLAALYESWSLPFSIVLVVPMCLLCSLVGVNLGRSDVNIFTQVGFFVLIGLACKNAILIVEFAKDGQLKERKNGRDATLEACRLRLRPIVMTSLAFILGVAPLMYGRGAGYEMRYALGLAVFSGMIGVRATTGVGGGWTGCSAVLTPKTSSMAAARFCASSAALRVSSSASKRASASACLAARSASSRSAALRVA